MEKIINLEEKSLYEVIKFLKTSDYMELRKNSKTEEEEEFYSRLEEMILRINQEKAISEGIFKKNLSIFSQNNNFLYF